MKAAWYEKQGAARDVLTVGEMDEPRPRPGEFRIRVAASGVNPGGREKASKCVWSRDALSACHSAH
jgi:NADPH2:quinone reductase